MKRLAAGALLCLACTRRDTPTAIEVREAGAAAPSPSASVATAGPLVDATAESDACGLVSAVPRSAKSIGHTSVVFKIETTDGRVHAWKPNAKIVKDRWRGEVAAYRLSEALGIHNVPPACARTFDAALVKSVIDPKIYEGLVVEGDRVKGAVIPWIDGLQFMAFEKEPLRSESKAWLDAHAKLEPARADLATQYSKMAIFDVITANWDRYSGGNIGADKSGTTLLFIDNDAAFMDRPPASHLKDNEAIVAEGTRFSRSFVSEVKKLDAARLDAILGAVLDHPRIEDVAKRAATVSAILAKKGEAALSMP